MAALRRVVLPLSVRRSVFMAHQISLAPVLCGRVGGETMVRAAFDAGLDLVAPFCSGVDDGYEDVSSLVLEGAAGVREVVPRKLVNAMFSRSSGPGGQHVNKVNTKADVRVQVVAADWLDDGARQRLIAMNRNRINQEGELVVTSQKTRSQKSNLDDAIRRLNKLVVDAMKVPKQRKLKTGPSKHTKKKYVENKRRRGEVKARRRGGGSRFD